MYDPNAANPYSALIIPWLEGPPSLDPFEQFIAFRRAEARFVRVRLGDPDRADELERGANDLELLIDAIRGCRISYEKAAEWECVVVGTIKNKVSAGTLCGGKGKVLIADLQIGPRLPGLKAGNHPVGRRNSAGAAEGPAPADEAEERRGRVKARVAEVRKRSTRSANRR